MELVKAAALDVCDVPYEQQDLCVPILYNCAKGAHLFTGKNSLVPRFRRRTGVLSFESPWNRPRLELKLFASKCSNVLDKPLRSGLPTHELYCIRESRQGRASQKTRRVNLGLV